MIDKFADIFYEEETEFDERINELKDSLRNQVKDEIKNRIEELTKRNEELEKKQKNLNSLEKEYQDKIKKFEYEKEQIIINTKREMYNAKLEQFLDFIFEHQALYKVESEFVIQKKCPYCDDNRYIKVKDILGREYRASCKCSDYKIKYLVKESNLNLYFCKRKGTTFKMILKANDDDYCQTRIFGFDGEECTMDVHYLCEKFEESNPPENRYAAYFTSKEEAQKYADYLNKLEQEKGEEKCKGEIPVCEEKK